jgi:hypothetical protein
MAMRSVYFRTVATSASGWRATKVPHKQSVSHARKCMGRRGAVRTNLVPTLKDMLGRPRAGAHVRIGRRSYSRGHGLRCHGSGGRYQRRRHWHGHNRHHPGLRSVGTQHMHPTRAR